MLAGELDEAAADFRHVLEEDSNDVEAIELLTQTLVVQEKLEEAIEFKLWSDNRYLTPILEWYQNCGIQFTKMQLNFAFRFTQVFWPSTSPV